MLSDMVITGALCVSALILFWSWNSPRTQQFFGAAFGIAGAALLATANPPAAGFSAFLASNVCWIVFSVRSQLWGLLAQQVVFLLTSVVGLWNWWLGPLLLG